MNRRLSPSEIENFRLLCLGACLVVGPLAGWLLPQAIWRSSSGTTSLGDYALMCCLALASWIGLGRWEGRGVVIALVASAAVFAVREVAWRFSVTTLSILYATATVALAGVVVASFYEFRKAKDLGEVLSPERIVILMVGIQVMVWTLFSTLLHLISA